MTPADRAVIRELVALPLMVSRPGYTSLSDVRRQHDALVAAHAAWEAGNFPLANEPDQE